MKNTKKIIIVIISSALLIAVVLFVNRALGYPKQYRTNNADYIDYQDDVIRSLENQYSVDFSFAREFDEAGVKTSISSKNVYSIKTADIEKESSFVHSQKIGNYISFDILDADKNVHLETKMYFSKQKIDPFIEEPPLTTDEGDAITVNRHSFTVKYLDNVDTNGCVFTSSDFNGYHVLGLIQYADSDAQKNSHEYLINVFLKDVFPDLNR